METFGERVIRLRKERKMTQSDLAERLNLSRPAISAYERGKSEPDLETLHKMAICFNVDLNTLIGGIKDTKSKKSYSMSFLYALLIIFVIIYIVYLLNKGNDLLYIITRKPEIIFFFFITSIIFFTFNYCIKTNDFSLLAGYEANINYNEKELASMLNTMAMMILIDACGYTIISFLFTLINLDFHGSALLLISYVFTFIIAILVTSHRYKTRIYLDKMETDRYAPLNRLAYIFIVFIIFLIAAIITINIFFKIPNNSPKAISETFILLPSLFINIVFLIITQDKFRQQIKNGQRPLISKKIYRLFLIDFIAVILLLIIAIS